MSNLQRKLKVAMERDSNAVLVKEYGRKELPFKNLQCWCFCLVDDDVVVKRLND
jgi:hypothetical protein